MIDLLDLKMSHPIIAAAGPLSSSEKGINNLFEVGFAAVTTKTIYDGVLEKKGYIDKNIYVDELLFNQDGFSKYSLKYWYDLLPKYQDKNLIVSIGVQPKRDIASIAENVEMCGARIIELCFSCPNSTQEPLCFCLDELQQICNEVRKKVHIPVLAKITITPIRRINREIVKVIEESGLNGITVTDTLPSILVCGGNKRFGGMSGRFLKPLVLKFLDDIEDINICKIAVGGVSSGQDVFDYIQCGANAVGICSALIKNGLQFINRIYTEYNEILTGGEKND